MATSPVHSYSSGCRLASVLPIQNEIGIPQIQPQFFYSSFISIDEPLSAHRSASGPDKTSSKGQLRPFARGDNNALEKAWIQLASKSFREEHEAARAHKSEIPDSVVKRRQRLIEELVLKHVELHSGNLHMGPLTEKTVPVRTAVLPVCCSNLHLDVSNMLQSHFCPLSRRAQPYLSVDKVEQDVLTIMQTPCGFRGIAVDANNNMDARKTVTPKILTRESIALESHPGHDMPAKVTADAKRRSRSDSRATLDSICSHNSATDHRSVHHSAADVGISGKPFLRVGNETTTASTSPRKASTLHRYSHAKDQRAVSPEDVNEQIPSSAVEHTTRQTGHEAVILDVVVGISELHKVSLPTLHMKPIYWSPVNDVAIVMRATWFYSDTMMPVAPMVANQLEAGYQELQPWTNTWRDELRCAVEVGALAEEKISHCLWPQDSKHFTTGNDPELEPKVSAEPFCSARCFQGDSAAQGSLDSRDQENLFSNPRASRAFSNYHVIYKDETEAFLLKPSLRPSAYYGRKPASKIARGITVGIPVTRGFDRPSWDRIHGLRHIHEEEEIIETPVLERHNAEFDEAQTCEACSAVKDSGQVTDLVLVAHGIGQKFAERVESFHFTHAINDFRRAVNLEMSNPAIQHVLRDGHNGAMILPLNWRMGLSFEDGGLSGDEEAQKPGHEPFGLKDIEPNTIPAIRSMISDVMFDIPFYMSHHKSKMINALVSEANRVYRLWCHNNPGFSERGRVHLIAHSLGSVMAVDILSRQPTEVPRLNLSQVEPETQFFEFNTTNLFLLGSPAGFFLLLERGSLMPRRGRHKPGSDSRDVADPCIASDAGRFGCLAVDNIYNVLAKEDPIAYLLNGAVDPSYADALKTAYVPSISRSVLKSIGDTMRNIVPGLSPSSPDALVTDPVRPSPMRLPSQLELEVHDFTREEIAEKKAYLLNDNGQIDWFLRSGGGPLEIQYLNMLSAHTSYWINQDFIRMLCLEIGRQPGRPHTIPAMRAAKVTKQYSLAK